MRRVALAVGMMLARVAVSPSIGAQPGPPPVASAPALPAPPALPPPLPPPPAPATAPAVSSEGLLPAAPPYGIAVVALGGAPGGAVDGAWPLAQAIYGLPSIRPPALDETHARILCGEAPPAGASPEARDLAESLAAIKGDDAPSRMLLGEIARKLNVRAIAVVWAQDGHPVARVFLAEAGAFDAASYTPDAGAAVSWTATARSLARAFGGDGAAQAQTSAPPLATRDEPAAPPSKGKPFYESGWFWGALGAAAFAGGAIFFATRDNGESTIHLQAQVPH